jgi:hypothetical protein
LPSPTHVPDEIWPFYELTAARGRGYGEPFGGVIAAGGVIMFCFQFCDQGHDLLFGNSVCAKRRI